MLLIILAILKIIGIIIAAILGLIVLMALILLNNPVRYRAKVNYDTDPDIEIKFSYIFNLIRGVIIYNKDGPDISVKVAWFNLSGSSAPSDKKHKTKKSRKIKESNSSANNVFEQKVIQKVQVAESVKPVSEDKLDADKSTETKESPESSKSHHNRFSDFSNKISGIKGSLSGIIANITDEDNKESFLYILKSFKKIIRHIHPQKHKICIYFGTPDPAITGQLTGALAVTATVLNLNMYVYPDFDKTMLKVNSWYKGRVRIIVLGIIFLRMYRNKKLKAAIKKLMK